MKARVALCLCLICAGLATAWYWGGSAPSATQRTEVGRVSRAAMDRSPVALSPKVSSSPAFKDGYVLAGRAIDIEASLRDRALRGDATAALNIYLKLARCADPMLAGIGEQQRAAYRLVGISNEQMDQKVEELGRECGGAEGSVQKRGEWLALAAEAGNEDAMLLYAADPDSVLGRSGESVTDALLLSQYKDRSLEYLNILAERGRADAMLSLSMAYKNSEYVPHDFVKSAAYRLAAEGVEPVEINAQPIDLTLKGLSSMQQAEAIELARVIRSRCCSM